MKVKLLLDKNMNMLRANQRRLLRAAGIYSGFFLLCYLVSRGIYSAGLPQVTTEYGSERKLGHTVETEGRVVSSRELAVTAEPGLLISSLLAEPGQQAEPGTPLLQLDLEYLDRKIETQEGEIKKLELQIKAMEENETVSDRQKETDRQRAGEDYANAAANADRAVGQAQSALEQAAEELSSLGSRKDYISRSKEQDPALLALKKNVDKQNAEYQAATSDGTDKSEIKSKKEALKEAKETQKAYEEQLEQTLGAEWETKKNQLEQAVSDCETSVRSAREEGAASLQAAARGMEDAGKEAAADSAPAVAEMELEDMKKQLTRYQKLKESGGIIASELEGDITRINVAAGELTGETAILILSDKAEGYRFLADITEEDKKYIELNDTATVQFRNGTSVDMPIDAIEEDLESGTYHISGRIDQNVKLGDSGTLTVQISSEQTSFCVPLEAVHRDMAEHYVLVAEPRQSILGEQLYAVKYTVTVKDQNEMYAAIEGSVSGDQKIILSSTKMVQEGDTIRLLEN